jgi:hypothetical protein
VNIGILTLHYGFNEGAVLQAMALARLLETVVPGAHAEVVDHRYPGKQAVYGAPISPREISIAEAVDNWLPLSQASFVSADAQPTLNYCRRNYDGLVVGSDVVWGLRYVGRLRRWFGRGIFRRQSDPFFPPFPNVYWPTSSAADSRVAYAACCGNLWWEDVPRSHRREMIQRLSGFSGISVRDQRTREFLRSLSSELGAGAEIVPDPTIAFDLFGAFDGSTALKKLQTAGYVTGEPHALVIMKEGPLSFRVVRHLRAGGWRIAATGRYGGLADINLIHLGLSPLEWAWVPRQFGVCVTERMHATIFCLLNHTAVLGLDMNRRLPATPTKLEELFFNVGLSDAYLHQEDTDEARLVNWLENAMDRQVDWVPIDAVLETQRAVAREFLRRSLT